MVRTTSPTFPSCDSSSPKLKLRGTVDGEMSSGAVPAARPGIVYLSRARYSYTRNYIYTRDAKASVCVSNVQ